MSADLVADTRNRILTARYHSANGIALDARTWIDAAERLADELEAALGRLATVRGLAERHEGDPHNLGCEGEPECAACWAADLNLALGRPVALVADRPMCGHCDGYQKVPCTCPGDPR